MSEKFKVAQMIYDDATVDEILEYVISERVRKRMMDKTLRKAGLSKGALNGFRHGGSTSLYTAESFLQACGYKLTVEVIE